VPPTLATSAWSLDPYFGLDGESRIPPTEFRIFPAGDFETEKGPFRFDVDAQTTVMESYGRRGVDLTMDYEHQALHVPPIEAPASCKSWVPQIRNGELWATECKWTDRAYGYLLSGEYRYFSPAFSHDEDGRIKEVLNIALTNIPAMRGIAPLVAASRTATGNKEGTSMDYEKLFKELQAQHQQVVAELTAVKASNAELTAKLSASTTAAQPEVEEVKALTAVLSLGATAGAPDRSAAVAALTSFRGNVRALTGADSDAVALGKVHAWKAAHGEVERLSGRVTELENEKLSGEFEGVLDAASAKGLGAADRAKLKTEALKLNGGRITEGAITFLRTCLSIKSFVPAGGLPQGEVKGGGAIDPLQVHIATVCGADVSKLQPVVQGK
jgi:phage I-like protein